MSFARTKRLASEVCDRDDTEERRRAIKAASAEREYTVNFGKLQTVLGPENAALCVHKLEDSFNRVLASLPDHRDGESVSLLCAMQPASEHCPLRGTVVTTRLFKEDNQKWHAAKFLVHTAHSFVFDGLASGVPVHVVALRPSKIAEQSADLTIEAFTERVEQVIESTGARLIACGGVELAARQSVDALLPIMVSATAECRREVIFKFGTRGFAFVDPADRVVFELLTTQFN
jgi:hypothetical protein